MTHSNGFEVPAVDISPYTAPEGYDEDARARVAAAVDAAARTVGFLQVTGHGIGQPVWDGLGEAIDAFFGLPPDEKTAFVAPPGINRGYTPPKTERLSLSLGFDEPQRMNDFFEAFNIGGPTGQLPPSAAGDPAYAPNLWPDQVDGFRDRIGAWLAEADRVARVLVQVFEAALGLPARYFDPFIDHSVTLLRLNNYALDDGIEVDPGGELIGMGEHTDFGIVTVLWADEAPGLQVLSDDVWHDVSPLPGAVLVNLGDLTARWTNERWRSTLHRVKPPVTDGRVRRRRSAAYFLDGNVDALITALPNTVELGEAPLYPPITVAEHIAAKLRGSRDLTPNTTGTEREAGRVVAAQS